MGYQALSMNNDHDSEEEDVSTFNNPNTIICSTLICIYFWTEKKNCVPILMSIKNNYFSSCPETYDQTRQTIIDVLFFIDREPA